MLHVRSTIGMYGAEQVIYSIARNSKSDFYSNSYFIVEGSAPGSEGLRDKLKKSRVDFDHIISNKKFDISVIKKIRSVSQDIVHTHDYKSLVLSVIALLFTNTKIVHHVHGFLGNTFAEKVYALVEQVAMIRASKIIVVSGEQEASFKKKIWLKKKIVKVNNGTVIPRKITKQNIKESSLKLVMAARFTPEKNHIKAIDVIAGLKDRGHKVTLTLLGDGPEYGRIKSYVESKDLTKEVEFIGFSKNVIEWIEHSDIMLFTSNTEGLPMSMLEAMASARSIVSTPVGEIPTILNCSNSGWVSDSVNGLISVLESLIENPDKRLQSNLNAYEYAKTHLSIDNQVEKLSNLYSTILSS